MLTNTDEHEVDPDHTSSAYPLGPQGSEVRTWFLSENRSGPRPGDLVISIYIYMIYWFLALSPEITTTRIVI
jgi:hypothetical protein